jgi:hypothetical protein
MAKAIAYLLMVMDTVEHDVHRPRRFEDLAGAADWARLRDIIQRPEPPSLLVVGPAGIGKSCALRFVLGDRITMWLRCSQDPTLRDSRDRIKAAALRKAAAGCVNWIVLEHADMLHADAQTFLRRILETSVGSTRFVLEVRDVAAIAEPLLSRTVLFNAPQLLTHEIRAEVMHRVPATATEIAERLAVQSKGNLRWAILQAIGGSSGCVAMEHRSIASWSDVLHTMEQIQQTGTNSRAYLDSYIPVWERPGGADPWALTAHMLARGL